MLSKRTKTHLRCIASLAPAALLLAAAACGPKTTTEEAGPAGTRLGGLGRAAANLPPEEESTTTSEETTTSSEAPPASDTAPTTVTTQAPVSTPPTKPPVTQAPVTTQIITQQQPPQNQGPTESPPKLTADNGKTAIQCPGNKVTIYWTGANLGSVTITLNGTQVGSGPGSGSATLDYACSSQARYNLAGSNSAGSATAFVDVYHS